MDRYRVLRLFGNGGKFFAYCRALVGNTDDAEDLVQDCLLKAMTSIDHLRDDAAFDAWFFRLIKNAFIDMGRRKKAAECCLDRAGEPLADCGSESPDEIALRRIENRTIWQAIGKLSPEHAEIIVLHYIMDHSVPEIVHITGERDGTVRSRISRARTKLRDVLLPIIEEDDL